MGRMIKKAPFFLLMLLWLVACSPTDNNGSANADAVSVPAELTRLVDEMTADVRTRSDKSITLHAIEGITWEDGSLGCPEPEMMYTMALVDGYKVVFTDGEHQFSYHTDGSVRYIYCDNPQK